MPHDNFVIVPHDNFVSVPHVQHELKHALLRFGALDNNAGALQGACLVSWQAYETNATLKPNLRS